MKYKPIIIGITGTKQSGKDTVASMINHMVTVGLAQADYYTWNANQNVYKDSQSIIYFADSLKQYCANIFNIPTRKFYDTDYKDNYVYCISDEKFIKRDELDKDRYYEIRIDDIKAENNNLMAARLRVNKVLNKISVISLRTIMQYIGTEIFRNLINKDFWVDNTMNRAKKIAETGHCIIADVRFENEAQAIIHSLYGQAVIKIVRDTKLNDSHKSETIDFNTTHIIENNGTKMALFYKVLSTLKDIVK